MTDATSTPPAPGDAPAFLALVGAAAGALKERRDEVNRLNVFPVPDGDTGTNMSLTMDAVMTELTALDGGAPLPAVCHAIQHGSLMGARGNSGVILSQILRGLCESLAAVEQLDAAAIAEAMQRAVVVAFQAVRKPVEGTMLTVLRDAATAAETTAADPDNDITAVLDAIVQEAYASVRRTPDLLPVLAEAGVVDAGGYGLAVLADGLVSSLEGRRIHRIEVDVAKREGVVSGFTPVDDWDDEEYLYCTEFLLFGEGLDRDAIHDRISVQGGSELVVGDESSLKVHVHTDDPASVLAYATGLGEIAEVHVNNMRRQTGERASGLREAAASTDEKPLGFVAVASGEGTARILESLGVDRIVSGGQTMNPSTADIVRAVDEVPARAVIVLPNNKNIVLAAQQAVPLAARRVEVVPTTSVLQAFSAMLAADGTDDVEKAVAAMENGAAGVRTGEITVAVRDSKSAAGPIKAGQVIGIADGEIVAAGTSVADVAEELVGHIAGDGETLTLLGGDETTPEQLEALRDRLAGAFPDLEIEAHDGGQPLYPIVMGVE